MRDDLLAIKAEHAAFEEKVKRSAQVRLEGNRQALAEWREFLTRSLSPQQVRDEMLAQQVRELSMEAIHHPQQGIAMQALEGALTTHTPAYQRTYVGIIRDQIHGGCQFCHTVQREIGFDYARLGNDTTVPSMLQQLHRSTGADSPGPAFGAEGGQGQGMPEWARTHAAGLPAVGEAWRQIDRIRPYMRALGSQGYRVIPDEVIDQSVDPAQLLLRLVELIEERRARLAEAKTQVGEANFDYLGLPTVIESLLILESDGVKVMVAADRRRRAEAAEQEAAVLLVAAGVSLLLMIFPPTAPLGLVLGAGLAIPGLIAGAAEFEHGRLLAAGRGAHDVFSPEEQETADSLMVSGLFVMALSAFDLGTAALTGINIVRRAGAIQQIEATANGNRIVVRDIESGQPVAAVTRPDGSGQTLRLSPQGATRAAIASAADLRREIAALEEAIEGMRSHPDASRMMDALDAAEDMLRRGESDAAASLVQEVRRRVDFAGPPAEGRLSSRSGRIDEDLSEFALREPAPLRLDGRLPSPVDATEARLLRHVEEAKARFEVEGFTPNQQRALESPMLTAGERRSLEAAYRGSRIDQFAKETVLRDPELQHVVAAYEREFGQDFSSSRIEHLWGWYDMTTPGQWSAHVRKYGHGGTRLPTEPRPPGRPRR